MTSAEQPDRRNGRPSRGEAHSVRGVLCRTFLLSALFVIDWAPAQAQQPVSEILSFLVTNQAVATGDFVKDRQAAEATRDAISRALLATLATLPVSSSSGGFTYRLNENLGTMERASESFGPLYVERAATAGKGQASFGVGVQHASFAAVDGQALDTGTLVTAANRFVDEPQPFDVEALTLHIRATSATLFGNVGVTDRLDLGFVVPMISLRLEGDRVNTYRGQSFLQARASAVTTGLADATVRVKYRLQAREGSGWAAAAEVRLPTGRKEDLLGAGRTALKLMAVGSVESGSVGVHVNAGYLFGGVSSEVDYGVAVAIMPRSRVTLSAEVLGRRLNDLGRIRTAIAPHPVIEGIETLRLLPQGRGADVILASSGLKWNIAGTWLLHAHLLVPLTDAGLTAPFIPTIALDYSFGR